LRESLGVESTLIRGQDGVFDVAVDGAIVFSKHQSGRFPGNDEIVRALRGAGG
jgi:selenoprotein W-related protein